MAFWNGTGQIKIAIGPQDKQRMTSHILYRGSALVLACLLLPSCANAARQKEKEEAYDSAMQQAQSAMAACDAKYQKGDKRYVEKAKCQIDATNIIRPIMPYPDLVDQDTATRMSLAEKLQAGKITEAQANQQLAQARSQINAEDQRRQLLDKSHAEQEDQKAKAARIAAPVNCASYGVVTNCF